MNKRGTFLLIASFLAIVIGIAVVLVESARYEIKQPVDKARMLTGQPKTDTNYLLSQPNPKTCFRCYLKRADLKETNLTDANLYGVKLDGVIGADFTGAKNVPKKYLTD